MLKYPTTLAYPSQGIVSENTCQNSQSRKDNRVPLRALRQARAHPPQGRAAHRQDRPEHHRASEGAQPQRQDDGRRHRQRLQRHRRFVQEAQLHRVHLRSKAAVGPGTEPAVEPGLHPGEQPGRQRPRQGSEDPDEEGFGLEGGQEHQPDHRGSRTLTGRATEGRGHLEQPLAQAALQPASAGQGAAAQGCIAASDG